MHHFSKTSAAKSKNKNNGGQKKQDNGGSNKQNNNGPDNQNNNGSNNQNKNNSDVPVKVTGITLSDYSKSIRAGETFTLKAVVTPANATDKSLKYTS